MRSPRLLLIAAVVAALACEPNLSQPLDRSGRPVQVPPVNGTAVLHFWGTWCAPCRAELPELAAFAAAHPEIRIETIAIDPSFAAVDRFLEDRAIALQEVYLDPKGRVARRFGVKVVPTTLVLGSGGTIVARFRGKMNWRDPSTLKEMSRGSSP
ncbi:MAG TPA: TlpA disulfide reductase family protein [Thermoanaerobaculia bacterium]|nr:TlpA disulfide reductase family protein [Thermoanaerobaculia bacterium]